MVRGRPGRRRGSSSSSSSPPQSLRGRPRPRPLGRAPVPLLPGGHPLGPRLPRPPAPGLPPRPQALGAGTTGVWKMLPLLRPLVAPEYPAIHLGVRLVQEQVQVRVQEQVQVRVQVRVQMQVHVHGAGAGAGAW